MNNDHAQTTRRENRDCQLAIEANRPVEGASPALAPAAPIHFRGVDGARGIAIISVLLYHAGWSTRGLFGVDAFFVISGFLITFLMMKELRSTGRMKVGRFFARRAKRLIPALIITLAVTLLCVWHYGTLDELRSAASTALFSLLQIANWHQVVAGGTYWEQTGEIVPLGQMWSLSVTEQFYMAWPLLMLLCWAIARRRPGRMVGILFLALVVSASVAPLLFDGSNTDRLYMGTDVRAVCFVAGAAFAALVSWILGRAPRWARDNAPVRSRIILTSLSAVLLALIVAVSVMTTSYHEAWLYQGGIAAVSIGIAAFTATLCFPANAFIRSFSWAPLRHVGVMSYSFFLLHLPVFWLLQQATAGTMHPLALFAVGGILTWLGSVIVHHVFAEGLRLRTWTGMQAAISIALSFALVAALTFALPLNKEQQIRASAAAAAAGSPVSQGASGNDIFPIDPSVQLTSEDVVTAAVIGDSVAHNMYSALDVFGSDQVNPVNVTWPGCGIFDADSARAGDGWVMDTQQHCWPWKDKLRAANAESSPDVYLLRNLWDANEQLIDGKWVKPGDPEWNDRYLAQLEALVSIGDELEEPPLILLANNQPRPGTSLDAERLAKVHEVTQKVISAHPNVRLLDFAKGACPQGSDCPTEDASERALYVDGVHFGEAGMALLAPWLENQIAKALDGR
ncbi:acyltransferase family protein [Microbacterium sp. NPDC089695]|uniref:acyltransferase family protein n=1 Tax=Microbacterium sp. NPDC089695 TaxID=3364198 RepID=UPI0037FE28D8